jgi:CheY-like chemotaxis protein
MTDIPITILVIDDDPLLGRALTDRLTEEGYAVKTAVNGQDGLAQALDIQPQLILLDYQMPDMDGLQVLKALRADERGKRVEVVFATNTYDTAVINEALGLGVHDYVLKADTSLDLIAELARKYVPLEK